MYATGSTTILAGLALFALGACAQSSPIGQKLELLCSTNQTGRYEKLEFRIRGPGGYTNAFDSDEVELNLQITAPGEERLTIPAFYCQEYERRRNEQPGGKDWMYPVGMPVWKARFAPMKIGTFRAVAILKDKNGLTSSSSVTFECVASPSKGFLRVSAKDPRFFEFTAGQPFFAIGQNLAFIGNEQYVTLSKAEQIFDKLAANGANYVRLWACCEDWALAIEARKSAWGRSWDKHPPIVPLPEGDLSGRKCVKLTGKEASLDVNPSHRVALRPQTRYVLSGKIKTEPDTIVYLDVHRTKPEKPVAAAATTFWTSFHQEFDTAAGDYWLERMRFRLAGTGTAWLSDLSLTEAAGGPELLWEADVNRSVRGFYNPLDCFLLDEILAAAEKSGIYVQLCLLTRDLYMDFLKDPASEEYEGAIASARKLFRYAVARWGYSTSVAAWEYWNEMNPGLPTDRFYSALGKYLAQADTYHHLRTTSAWGPSPKDCRHPELDIADAHFYLRPSDRTRLHDEVEAVIERTKWLRDQAPDKPAHLGEFGLADEKWQLTEEMKQSRELLDVHHALWASALSGASGTALPWWWERLDARNAYPLYGPVSRFIANVPWTSGSLLPASATVPNGQLRVVGLQAKDLAWLWLFDPRASWAEVVGAQHVPPRVTDGRLEVKNLAPGPYRVQWQDTRELKTLREDRAMAETGALRLTVPAFAGDIAVKVSPEK